jgi:hypothetical protein
LLEPATLGAFAESPKNTHHNVLAVDDALLDEFTAS